MLKAHFGVSIPDSTVQVPEYLAGKRIPLNMSQVLQTSENGSSPLGTTGAFSNTFSKDKMFVKSFTFIPNKFSTSCYFPFIHDSVFYILEQIGIDFFSSTSSSLIPCSTVACLLFNSCIDFFF